MLPLRMTAEGGVDVPETGAGPVPFGKYLLLDRVAVGGMAEVFLAKTFGVQGFERLVAVKRILSSMADDQSFIEMFVDEAKIVGHLSHANIAGIYELGKVGNAHYIAMEYVWGKDLLQVMNRHRLFGQRIPPQRAAFIAAKMCDALDYAHNKRDARGRPLELIHRDVSPQNVLVSFDGNVKIIDFGIAKAQSRTTKTVAGFVKGKFGYMSPEQVRGKKLDPRSDIFAVGICLYEMLTCDRLFVGESDFETMDMIRAAKIPPLSSVIPDVPRELDAIVMRALSREPQDRFQTAGELSHALMGWLMTQRPPYTMARLAEWMQTAFEDEMRGEKGKLDSYRSVGPEMLRSPRSGQHSLAGVKSNGSIRAQVTDPKLKAAAAAFEDEEKTVVDDAPSVATTENAEEEWLDQPTQVFFSADEAPPLEAPPATREQTRERERERADQTGKIWPSDLPEAYADARPSRRPIARRGTWIQAMQFFGSTRGILALALAVAIGLLGTWWLNRGTNEASLDVIVVPASVEADVSIDGRVRGRAPLRLDHMAPGLHIVDVIAPGYRASQARVQLEEGRGATVQVELAPDTPAP